MRKIQKHILLLIFILGISLQPVFAQLSGGGEGNPRLHTNQQALKKWQDMRFGMFVHWGPVTLRGTEIGWSRGAVVPKKDYDSLYKEFDPVLFDADKWVKTAKEAGMKYLIITAKHHDGFCLWDSQYTEYDIMNTPYKKDIVKALADACKKQGIIFGIYYSILDWHHSDYPAEYPNFEADFPLSDYGEGLAKYGKANQAGGYTSEAQHRSMGRYVRYMKNQLKELVENYDPQILWFDGYWEWPWTHKMGMDLYAYLRDLKSDLLINNRIDKRQNALENPDIAGKFAGDFKTPEQQVGNYDTQTPWESCITIAHQWAWKPNDHLKSNDDLVKLVLNTVGGDGNLLLNVGPMPDGRIEQRQIDRLKKLGQWIKQHKEAIYGTMGGPYVPTETLASTRRGNHIFIHLLKKPGSQWKLPLPNGVRIESAHFMSNGQRVPIQSKQGEVKFDLPDNLPGSSVSVIELIIDQNAEQLDTIRRFRY